MHDTTRNRFEVKDSHVGLDGEEGLVTIRFELKPEARRDIDQGINFALDEKRAELLVAAIQAKLDSLRPR